MEASQTITVQTPRIIHAYQRYHYGGMDKVVPPYEWFSRVRELLNIPLHFWGTPLLVQKRFFEVDDLGVMSPREWASFCGVEVLTMPMFDAFDLIIKDIGGKDTDYIKIVWMNNADKWKVLGTVSEYSILDNPPSGAVIVGSFIGGDLPPLWSDKYQRLFILRVNSRGHDISLDRAVTDYTCNLFAGLTP
jgi:hypothetical protein